MYEGSKGNSLVTRRGISKSIVGLKSSPRGIIWLAGKRTKMDQRLWVSMVAFLELYMIRRDFTKVKEWDEKERQII